MTDQQWHVPHFPYGSVATQFGTPGGVWPPKHDHWNEDDEPDAGA